VPSKIENRSSAGIVSSTDRIRKENDDKIHKEPSKKNPSIDISL
jgi:hypothetical protein